LQHNKNGVDDLQEGSTPEVSRQLLQYKANDLAQQFLLAQTGICEKWTAFYQKKISFLICNRSKSSLDCQNSRHFQHIQCQFTVCLVHGTNITAKANLKFLAPTSARAN
jgi:hypothetical protein